MKKAKRIRLSVCLVAGICVAAPMPASASMFGEENTWLAQIYAAHLEELIELSTIVANIKMMVGTLNDGLALSRRVKRTYDTVRNYNVDDLRKDALEGFYRAYPEARDLESEFEMLVDNGEAINEGRFFSHYDRHDVAMRRVNRRAFQHAYRSTIYPALFPKALELRHDPTPVEALIQARYERTGDNVRRAVQRTAFGVLAQKVNLFVEESDTKGNLELQAQATSAQIALQALQNAAEMRNLREQDAAVKELEQTEEKAFRENIAKSLAPMVGDELLRKTNLQ